MSVAKKIDRSSPVAKRAGLGTKLAELIAKVNALQADVARVYANNNYIITAPTLAMEAGAKKTAKSSTAFKVVAGGVVQAKSADQAMSVLAGTLAAGKYALWAFYIDAAGTITTSTKTADQTSAAAAVAAKPAIPADKVELGYIVVHNGTAGNFTANATLLDATDVTVTYVSSAALAAMTATPVGELTYR